MLGVPHHLLDCIDPKDTQWTVVQFASAAENAIRDIRARGRVPIVVGGTHYYMQSLLFKSQRIADPRTRHLTSSELAEKWPVLLESNETILEALWKVDPIMARRWHPKDHRKIKRSLEIWLEMGRKPSEIYAEQRDRRRQLPDISDEDGAEISPTTKNSAPRHDSLLLWLYCEPLVLEHRLKDRVERMMADGLLQEIEDLRGILAEAAENGSPIDTGKGVWAAIGHKEFEHYLQSMESGASKQELEQIKSEAVDRIKIATRQYAKRQTRWIRQKLLPEVHESEMKSRLFLLDCSDVENWSDAVANKAWNVTQAYLAGQALPDPRGLSGTAASLLSSAAEPTTAESFVIKTCDMCELTIATSQDWDNHIKGKRHKAILRRQRKRARRPTPLCPEDVASQDV